MSFARHFEQLLFYEVDVQQKCKLLTPRRKARVVLCKEFLLQRATRQILDEPTNHLDPGNAGGHRRQFPFQQFDGTYTGGPATILLLSNKSASAGCWSLAGRSQKTIRVAAGYYYELNTADEE